MLVEFARNVAGLGDAAHAETDPDALDPVVARLSCSLVGEERQVTAVPGTRVAELCGTEAFTGFHWCNFGLSPAHEAALTAAGLVVAARAPTPASRRSSCPATPSTSRRSSSPRSGAPRAGGCIRSSTRSARLRQERSATVRALSWRSGMDERAATGPFDISLTPEGARLGTPRERAARGKAARGTSRGPAMRPSRPPPGRADPVELLEAPGARARAGAGADPVRPDAGVAVHVLPRAPRRSWPPTSPTTPRSGLLVAVLRRRAPVELRRVRLARAAAGVRHQRLRRDAARPVGVGRQAAGGEPADRGARQRVRRQGAARGRARRGRGLPGARCASFAAMRNLDVWYAHLDVEDAGRASSRPASTTKRVEAAREARRPRRGPRTACRRSRSSPHVVDGEPRIVSDPPLIVPLEELVSATSASELEAAARARCSARYRDTPAARPAPPAGAVPLVDLARKVVGVGSVGTRALDRAPARPRRPATRCSCRSRRRRPRCSSRYVGHEPVRQPRRSASSPASA